MGIAQDVFDPTGTFDTSNGMFDADADPREGAIVSLLPWGQFLPAGLFLG